MFESGASARRLEHLKPLIEEPRIRTVGGLSRKHHQSLTMQFLESEAEHWPVDLGEDVVANLEHQVRPDADDVPVECCVVNFA
jgi:hypothetical protein